MSASTGNGAGDAAAQRPVDLTEQDVRRLASARRNRRLEERLENGRSGPSEGPLVSEKAIPHADAGFGSAGLRAALGSSTIPAGELDDRTQEKATPTARPPQRNP